MLPWALDRSIVLRRVWFWSGAFSLVSVSIVCVEVFRRGVKWHSMGEHLILDFEFSLIDIYIYIDGIRHRKEI